MTAREATCRRKRRIRAEERARLYREYVCGGPLIDIDTPVIGGPGDLEHMALVKAELELRARNVQREARLLALDFAHRCCLVRGERVRMYLKLVALWREVGPPGVAPTHSTSSAQPTTTGTTIPRL
jgi:hypothetical protein